MLSIVKEMPPATTLLEMAGGNPERVSAVIQREFGKRAVLIAASNLYVFEDNEFPDATIGTQLSDTGLVSGVFRGLETVETMELARPNERLSLVTEVQRQLAVFATHMDWDISDAEGNRMQANDTSIASGYPRVAITLDEPVNFYELKSEARIQDEESQTGFKLHLVGESA
jgi:hypothetical protein